jgi:hypothetical protein
MWSSGLPVVSGAGTLALVVWWSSMDAPDATACADHSIRRANSGQASAAPGVAGVRVAGLVGG